jgi:hypothetical protein
MSSNLTLLLSTISAFVLTLLIYLIAGSNPLNRIGYAVLVSLSPAIITFIAMKIWKLSARWTVITYVVLFLVMVIVQAVMRYV